ncbi:hypothetical protein BSU04_15135 [Caballeronia sordidicola]|uniref:Uncharacterized protein n=1 Tax=Caballeronia sordidicola TaxID=196367 RepID=A0A226X2Z5_CABSO|nr:hypothetical protein BSU04_15135 [Caballeronia sordidicola]
MTAIRSIHPIPSSGSRSHGPAGCIKASAHATGNLTRTNVNAPAQ